MNKNVQSVHPESFNLGPRSKQKSNRRRWEVDIVFDNLPSLPRNTEKYRDLNRHEVCPRAIYKILYLRFKFLFT